MRCLELACELSWSVQGYLGCWSNALTSFLVDSQRLLIGDDWVHLELFEINEIANRGFTLIEGVYSPCLLSRCEESLAIVKISWREWLVACLKSNDS